MPDEKEVDVRTLSRADYEKAKRDTKADLLRLAPRYRLTEPVAVPLPTVAGTNVTVPVRNLGRGDYENVKQAVRRKLSGFGSMAVSPGLDEATKR